MRNDFAYIKCSNRVAFSFNYTDAIHKVCEDICFRVPEFSHVDIERVAVSYSQSRNSSSFGVYASLTPLRFENGEKTRLSRGKTWGIQRLLRADGTDYLYVLFVCVPRFMDLKLTDKLETIVHELYHIGPNFDGDLRRFKGRCYAHGSSRKKYDATVRVFLKKWLDQNPSPEIWDFLQMNYNELCEKFGSVAGTKIPPPKIFPIQK